jgi:hypothetical protein
MKANANPMRCSYLSMITFILLICAGCKKTNSSLPYAFDITLAGKPVNLYYQAYVMWDSFTPFHTGLLLQGIDSATKNQLSLSVSALPNVVKPGGYLLDGHVGNIIYINYENGQTYQSDSVVLNITFMDSVSVRGNFNGRLTVLMPVANPNIALTVNGSFNLPFQ